MATWMMAILVSITGISIAWIEMTTKHQGQGQSLKVMACMLTPLIVMMSPVNAVYLQHACSTLHLIWFDILLTLAYIDVKQGILPDSLTLLLLILGLVQHSKHLDFISGALIGYYLPWITNQAYTLIKNQPGLGGGDMKLLSAIGAWLGIHPLLITIIIASQLGIIHVFTLHCLLKRPIQKALPWGPYLTLSAMGTSCILWH